MKKRNEKNVMKKRNEKIKASANFADTFTFYLNIKIIKIYFT